MTSTSSQPAVIVGGGVSGLAAAYFLLEGGIRPLLIEKSKRYGGLIQTDLIDGCELEAGPDSFIATKPAVAALARKLGIAGEIIGSNDAGRRIFMVRDGKLAAMPAGMVFMVPGDLRAALGSGFFSPAAKLRFLKEQLYLPRTRTTDVSIREFVVDHFGEESLDYVTEPLLSGVYGGDAGGLSARSVLPRFVEFERKYGSLIRGVREDRSHEKGPGSGGGQSASLFQSFRGGMQTLTDALERSVGPRARAIQAEADFIEKTATGWRVHFGGEQVDCENLVLACPAHVNAHLLRTACPELSEQLASIPYSSALLATLVYERSELGHPLNGFGFLVPRRERNGVAAATWISTKFPSRTPENRAALRAFIVGSEAIEWMRRGDSDVIDLVRKEFARLMGISAKPLFTTIYRWPNSMPQYTVGHEARRNRIMEGAAGQRGLHLCGNAYDGVGIPDCIRLAGEIADRLKMNENS